MENNMSRGLAQRFKGPVKQAAGLGWGDRSFCSQPVLVLSQSPDLAGPLARVFYIHCSFRWPAPRAQVAVISLPLCIMARLIWMSGQLSKSGEQAVHSPLECCSFFFSCNNWFSTLTAHYNHLGVFKIADIAWLHPKSMIFKSQRVESGICICCKSPSGDSNLQPVGKSAWDQGSLLPCMEMAFLSWIFLKNIYETINNNEPDCE